MDVEFDYEESRINRSRCNNFPQDLKRAEIAETRTEPVPPSSGVVVVIPTREISPLWAKSSMISSTADHAALLKIGSC